MRTLPRHADVFQLRVALRHIKPAIWRELEVPAAVSLASLHDVLQIAFGWTNSHLHEFRMGGIRFATPYPEDETLYVDDRSAPLGAVVNVGDTLLYHYDFGDDWEHDVVVTGNLGMTGRPIACVAGERACPPEDCGGPPGYERVLGALANPKDPQYEELVDWIPRKFAPEKFDLARVNKQLATLTRRLARFSR